MDLFSKRCGCGAIYKPAVATSKSCSKCESTALSAQRSAVMALRQFETPSHLDDVKSVDPCGDHPEPEEVITYKQWCSAPGELEELLKEMTPTGRSLDSLGSEWGYLRMRGETDAAFRERIRAQLQMENIPSVPAGHDYKYTLDDLRSGRLERAEMPNPVYLSIKKQLETVKELIAALQAKAFPVVSLPNSGWEQRDAAGIMDDLREAAKSARSKTWQVWQEPYQLSPGLYLPFTPSTSEAYEMLKAYVAKGYIDRQHLVDFKAKHPTTVPELERFEAVIELAEKEVRAQTKGLSASTPNGGHIAAFALRTFFEDHGFKAIVTALKGGNAPEMVRVRCIVDGELEDLDLQWTDDL